MSTDPRPVTFPKLWHTAQTPEAVAGIRAQGFRVGRGEMDGAHFGAGIYFSSDRAAADRYFEGCGDYGGVQFTAEARVRRPYRVDAEPDCKCGTTLLLHSMAAQGLISPGEKPDPEEITARLRAAGYDSVYVHQPVMDDFYGDDVGGSQLLVFEAGDVALTPGPGRGENQLPGMPGEPASEPATQMIQRGSTMPTMPPKLDFDTEENAYKIASQMREAFQETAAYCESLANLTWPRLEAGLKDEGLDGGSRWSQLLHGGDARRTAKLIVQPLYVVQTDLLNAARSVDVFGNRARVMYFDAIRAARQAKNRSGNAIPVS